MENNKSNELDLPDEDEWEIIPPTRSPLRSSAILDIPEEEPSMVIELNPIGGNLSLELPDEDILPVLELPDEELDEEMLRFMDEGNKLPELTLDDEEEVDVVSLIVPEGPRSIRLRGESASVEARSMASSYETSLHILKATQSIRLSTAGEDSAALGEIVQTANLSFLTPGELSNMIQAVFKNDKRDDVLKEFYSQTKRNFTSMERLTIAAEVNKILMIYSQYMGDRASSSRVLRDRSLENDPIMSKVGEDLNLLMNESHDAVYVSKVVARPEGYYFTCDKCGSESFDERGFFTLVVHEDLADKTYLKVFPRACICDSCGTPNILTQAEHIKVSTELNVRYQPELQRWYSTTSKISKDVNIIEYSPDYTLLPAICPEVYSAGDVFVEDVRAENFLDLDEIRSWYEETQSFIKTLRVPAPKTEGGTGVVGSRIIPVYDDLFVELEVVVKTYCGLFSEDFNKLLKNASNSFVSFITDNPVLTSSLSAEPRWNAERTLVYEKYLEIPEVIGSLGLLNSIIRYEDRSGNMKQEATSLDEGVARLREIVATAKQELKDLDSERKELLEVLDSTYLFASAIPISNISETPQERLIGLLAQPEIKQWIHRCALVMILNKLSSRIRDAWSVKTAGDYKNKSMFSLQSTKPLEERVDMLAKAYNKERGYGTEFKMMKPSFVSFVYGSEYMQETLSLLHSGISNADVYKFYRAVTRANQKGLPGSLGVIPGILYDLRGEAESFFGKYKEDSDFDYYRYHYGMLFSDEEIERGLVHLPERMWKKILLDRKENERFDEYIKRISSVDSHSIKGYMQDPARKVFSKLLHVFPLICMAYELSKKALDEPSFDDVMRDLVYFSSTLGSKNMYSFLGLPLPYRTSYEGIGKSVLEDVDIEQERIRHIAQGLLLPSDELADMFDSESEDPFLALTLVEGDKVSQSLDLLGKLGEEIWNIYGSYSFR